MTNDDRAPELDELRRELEAVGMVVVPFRNEIHVRRSTLEYIKVRVEDGVLRCEARIGVVPASRGFSRARQCRTRDSRRDQARIEFRERETTNTKQH